MQSWQIFQAAIKNLPAGVLQKIYTRSCRLISYWAADPQFCNMDPWMINAERQFDSLAEKAMEVSVKISASFDTMANRSADALADFVTSGKFSFKEFSNSVTSDLVRIQTRTLMTDIFSNILPAATFVAAPRLHHGLAPDEYPAILQRGEAVLSKNQVREGMRPINVKFNVVNEASDSVIVEQPRMVQVSPDRIVGDLLIKRRLTDRNFRNTF